MDKEEIKAVWDRYKAGTSTAEDMALLETWFMNYEHQELPELSEAEVAAQLKTVYSKLPVVSEKTHTRKLWAGIAAAASVVICLGVGLYFYQHRAQISTEESSLIQNDIAPGGNKAYLTLANGKRISLTEAVKGELAKQAGIRIVKTADDQVSYRAEDDGADLNHQPGYNTIETPRGGQFQLLLPDGTKVWLNAASSLKFPASFTSAKVRGVELKGEAYFEVAHNKTVPFKVKTAGQEVEVLGTHFNINSYDDEPFTKTTLLEGSVAVNRIDTEKRAILKPGQQTVLTTGALEVKAADLASEMAWKNGLFRFNDEKLESIMRKVSRWYDVAVVYENEGLKNEPFAGVTTRFARVSELLRMMALTNEVKFKVNGRQITVMNAK